MNRRHLFALLGGAAAAPLLGCMPVGATVEGALCYDTEGLPYRGYTAWFEPRVWIGGSGTIEVSGAQVDRSGW